MSMRGIRAAAVLAAMATALGAGATARAQWGYPGGYGGFGFGGFGMGGETVQGSVARGMGAYAAGAGYYNQQTAVANSINTDTVMRFNDYMYQNQRENNRNERARLARRQANVSRTREEIEKRLRDNPDSRDIYQGDALNLAMEEVTDPRVYSQYMQTAKAKIGGESVKQIPFQYAPGAITVSIHRITQSPPPKALLVPAFEEDRAALQALRTEIRAQLDEGKDPEPALIDKALAIINAAEAKVDSMYPKNARDRVEADRYLKALHGLVAMLKTPALDFLLKDVEKRKDATLGELLTFMGACNLRFGPATTPQQRLIYDDIFSKLRAMRDEVAPALAKAEPPKAASDEAAGEFFSGMDYGDLKKKAPAPAPPKPETPK
jgi:hypothetical protein